MHVDNAEKFIFVFYEEGRLDMLDNVISILVSGMCNHEYLS